MENSKNYPKLIQLNRSKGWRKPENTVYVGRPSKWGNLFEWDELLKGGTTKEQARKIVVQQYEDWIHTTEEGRETIRNAKQELKGKNLACWCPVDGPCHGKILLRIANE